MVAIKCSFRLTIANYETKTVEKIEKLVNFACSYLVDQNVPKTLVGCLIASLSY